MMMMIEEDDDDSGYNREYDDDGRGCDDCDDYSHYDDLIPSNTSHRFHSSTMLPCIYQVSWLLEQSRLHAHLILREA